MAEFLLEKPDVYSRRNSQEVSAEFKDPLIIPGRNSEAKDIDNWYYKIIHFGKLDALVEFCRVNTGVKLV